MRRLFCFGKQDYCDQETCIRECEFHDGSGCEYRKIETNADRIRATRDVELANIMIQFTDIDCRIDFCQGLPECAVLLDTEDGIPLAKCERCLYEWLRKPAEQTPPATMAIDDKRESGLVEEY